ncbi:hypothetical protein M7I_4452 [Glarea lozoyensis 74030]|uniref:Uncharacterized protein n=1 Tax=Glarea lozoyensis (strain ATCC 74030 / MF5533) TaxID=1104152 RepID=H0EP81_GLAL7|nr:hypothetical protein M7I_4452 [Glarea lozoyensis 74030]
MQQTDGYSPYASPVDLGLGERVNEKQLHGSTNNSNNKLNMAGDTSHGKQNGIPKLPGAQSHQPNNGLPKIGAVAKSRAASLSANNPSNQTSKTQKPKSLEEAQKKASAAILNLLPYNIRYQTYLDEGFAEDLVGRLFDDLQISRVLAKINNDVGASRHGANDETGEISHPVVSKAAEVVPKPQLSEKSGAKRTATPDTTTLPKIIAQPTTVNPSVSMSEKDRALQLKMEALRKSREERAQKAAAKASTKSPIDATPPVPLQVQPQAQPSISEESTKSTTDQIGDLSQQAAPAKPAEPPVPQPSPKQTAVIQTKVSSIPGLFLTSTDSTSTPTSTNAVTTTVLTSTLPRKRPVAADFDPPNTSATQFKRPFGQSRTERPVVIDVSEDEADSDDEDVAMDLESQADQDSPVQSAPSTPPGSQSAQKSGLGGRPEVLQQKETEIELLKKKIAEAEARKKARQTPTGTSTPMGQIESKAISETQIAESSKAAELKKIEDERKRLRLQKLTSDLPLVEKEVLENQSKLENMRAEMARLEEVVRKNNEAKRLLTEEMDRLGRETEEQLQVQREKLHNLAKEESDVINAEHDGHPTAKTDLVAALPLTENTNEAALSSREVSQHREATPAVADQAPALIVETPPQISETAHETPEITVGELVQDEVLPLPLPRHDPETKEQTSADRALEAALQEAVRAEADSHAQGYSDTEMETSFAPDPDKLMPASEIGPDSPDYSPVLERAVPVVPEIEMAEDSDIYEPPEGTPPVDEPLKVLNPPSPSPSFSPAPPEADSRSVPVEETSGVVSEIKEREPEQQPEQQPDDHEKGQIVHKQTPPQANSKLVPVAQDESSAPATTTELFTPYQSPLKHDAVLTALGSPDQFGPTQRAKFCAGLKGVLTDLRARKIKDFDMIADEIIAHRAKFLGDDSKVLNLEGITI